MYLEEMLNQMLNELVEDSFSKANAEIKLKIDGRRCIGKCDGDKLGLLMAISCIVDTIANNSDTTRDEIISALKGMWAITSQHDCESPEQANVIEQIIKNGLKPEK